MNKFASRFINTAAAVREVPTDTGTEPAVISNPTDYDGEALAGNARAMAAKETDAMSAAVNVVMKAKEDWQGGPIRVLLALQASYTPEELASFPVPDSDTGNNPDKFKIEVVKDGSTVKRPTTWYTQFADATKEGKAICDRIEMIERAAKTDTVKTGIPEDILSLNPTQREVELNRLKGRRNTIRASYKKAVALNIQFNLVNEMDGIQAEPIWIDGKEGEEVENTTKPIAVWQIPEEGKPVKNWEAYSVGSFMKLSVGKALEKGGTFKALKESVTRAKAGAVGNNAAATKTPAIATLETLLERMVEVHSYAMDKVMMAKDTAEYGTILKTLNSKGADELVTTFVELKVMFDQIYKDAKLGEKYQKIQLDNPELISKVG